MVADAHLVFIGSHPLALEDPRGLPEEHGCAPARPGSRPASRSSRTLRPGLLTGLSAPAMSSCSPGCGFAPRNLIIQKPRHAAASEGRVRAALAGAAEPGRTACRAPRRAGCRLPASLALDAIDVLDGTPVIDLKPYFASIDSFPGRDAATPQGCAVIANASKRRKAIAEALTLLLPGAPYADIEAIRTDAGSEAYEGTATDDRRVAGDASRMCATSTPTTSSCWRKATTATPARFFVIDRTNDVLTSWRATRLLDPDDEE